MQRLSYCFALAAFLCLVGLAEGQVSPGFPSFIPQDCGQYDCINLQNLNVSLNVPVMSKSGAFPFKFSFIGNDSYVGINSGSITPGVLLTYLNAVANGVLGINGNVAAYTTATPSVSCPLADGTGLATKYTGWYITLADGSVHQLPSTDASYSGLSCTGSFSDQTIDGTGYTLSVTGYSVNSIYTTSGMSVSSSQLEDSNGNKITDTSAIWTDTLGVTAVTQTGTPGWQWTDVNGNPQTVSWTEPSATVKTVYGCYGVTDYPATPNDLVTSVNFPDSTSLGIAYEATPGYSSDRTGRISQLTLRTGSTVAFNYNPNSASNDGLNCTYLTPDSLTRTTSDGTVSYTLAYTTSNGYVTVTDTKLDIGGNKTIYTFESFPGPVGYLPGYAYPPTQVQYFPNTGTVSSPTYSGTALKAVTYCYNTYCSTNGGVALPITQIDAYTNIGVSAGSSRQEVQYDGGPGSSLPHYGNVTYSAQYDFGATTPSRATTTVYGSSNGSGTCSAIGNYVNNKPCTIVTQQITATGGSLVTVSSAQYTYDSYGNLLKTYISPNGGSSYLSNATSNVYNTNGTISQSYDFAGNETTYSYSSGCNNLFPTQIKNVTTGDYTSSTWNCTGGVKLTDTDASGNTTTYGYVNSSNHADPWWRVMSILDPLSNKTWNTYTVTSFESSLEFNSSNSIQNLVETFDGYGRIIDTQKQQGVGSSNYDTVSTYYTFPTGSQVNPTVQTTMPCSTTLGVKCGTTYGPTSTYDMLGRVISSNQSGSNATDAISYSENDVLSVLGPAPSGENTKQVQNEYDGLGRLTSSCKVSSSATGNVSCGQNTATSPTHGILTTTVYTAGTGTQQITNNRGPGNQQQRSITMDGMGRTIYKITPEGGTWSYTYDHNGSCPSGWQGVSGQLASIADPNSDLICFKYDALNRVTDMNANGTTCRHFRFDATYGTVPSGVTTPTNTTGRIAEASTDNCSGTLITDEWFSYDKDGNVTDQWESTPNSTQYYHSSATFTGPALLTVDLASPSTFTLTYGLDGEGRPSSVKKGNNYIVASAGVTYNPAGQPTNINLGAGSDYDSYTYYPDTGLMKTWTFQTNSVQETAQLNWNPNGTLNNLAITDGFNSGGTQTCYFNPSSGSAPGYDDLLRLLYVSCGSSGSIWNQTFTYDQYDNLTKASTGFVSWNPTYSQTTNHYGCSGCTTDSNGNVTYDGSTTYTWNEFSKMKTVTGGGTLVYDAFGRVVEIDNGGTDTEIWYTQLGKTAFMHGKAYSYVYLPAPGGGLDVVGSSGPSHFHKDWLGNSRISSTTPTSGNGVVGTDRAYAPYGEVYDIFGQTNTYKTLFIGSLTQDVVAGIYDTPKRELQGAQQGRFLSPDPGGSGWNQYAYVTNPNSFSDPSGLGPLDCVEGESDPSVSGGCQEYSQDNGSGGYGGPQFGAPPPDDWGAFWGTLAALYSAGCCATVEADFTPQFSTRGTDDFTQAPSLLDPGESAEIGASQLSAYDDFSGDGGDINLILADFGLLSGSNGGPSSALPSGGGKKVVLINRTCQNPHSFIGYSGSGTIAGNWASPGTITPSLGDTLMMGWNGHCVPWENGQCYMHPIGNGCSQVDCPGDTRSVSSDFMAFNDPFPVHTVATICARMKE
jgi:hypothetical protein